MNLVFGALQHTHSQAPENSVLSSGDVYKIAITKNDIYKIDASLLNELGINTNSVDPDNIKILGYGGGMLPQPNSIKRFKDLPETAVNVKGGGDGAFNSEDYILFYAQGPDKAYYDSLKQRWVYEKNLYADTAYYFIKISEEISNKVALASKPVGTSIEVNQFDELIHHEIDEINHLDLSSNRGGSGSGSGRRWFGERFDFNLNYDFSFPLSGVANAAPVKISTALMSSAPSGGVFEISTNQGIGKEISIASVPETTYGIKGRIAEETLSGTFQNTDVLELSFAFEKRSSSSKDAGYLDYFTLEFKRRAQLYGTHTLMRFAESGSEDILKIQLQDAPNEAKLWDVTDIANVQEYAIETEGASKYVHVPNTGAKELVLLAGEAFEVPLAVGKVEPQDLHSVGAVNLLIIVPPFLKSEASRLADFRNTHDGLSSAVATTEEIYNEFSSGRQDITAIRDFIRHIYLKSNAADSLKYVLLFGDGSFDYKNRLPETANSSLIPIYESYESLHPIYSYSSDDYFSFMDKEEGAWSEAFNEESHLMDVGIGRLPVNTLEEAKAVVDKLIRYATAKETLGKWRKRIAMVADDGDANTHQLQADRLGRFIESNYQLFNTNRIFVDAYPQVVSTNTGKRFAPEARAELEKNIDNGVLIMNFSGHGAETGWTSEDILTNGQIVNWKNKYKMPLLVTATCEFGRYDNPTLNSGAELALLNAEGGAIALLTTTRPVFSNTNFLLNQAFYEAAFEPVNGEMPRLGDILVKTKNNSITGVINRNFALLGDPSMRLAYPQEDIKITSIKNRDNIEVDTIQSLDLVRLEGEVQFNGVLSSDFNGTLEATVYDKTTTITTLGDEGPNTVMDFEDRLSVIFRGTATVNEGRFSLEFLVPKNIDYNFDEGKISLYASHDEKVRDAAGAIDELIVGGSSNNFVLDSTPPDLLVYLDEPDFKSGDFVGENATLFVDIFDESGINITGNGIGQQITATLNGEFTVMLNDFYKGALDDYKKGRIRYSLVDLEPGLHSLSVKVWDNQNNLAEQKILFRVGQIDDNSIGQIIASPNPFIDNVQVSYFNAFQGEQIELQVAIYDVSGKLVNDYYQNIANSTSNVNIVDWNGYSSNGYLVKSGLYLIKAYIYYPSLNISFDKTLRITKY